MDARRSLAEGAAAAAAARKQAELDAGLTSSFTAGLGAGAKKVTKAESWRAKNQHGGGGEAARAELSFESNACERRMVFENRLNPTE